MAKVSDLPEMVDQNIADEVGAYHAASPLFVAEQAAYAAKLFNAYHTAHGGL